MQVRDRIKELRRVPAAELLPNPRNWRTHPALQRQALEEALAEIGYADALLARELPDGRLMLIDGHLRAETTPHMSVPVLVVDVTDSEADMLLATLDPLAGLAGKDEERLLALLANVQTESAAVEQMLAELAAGKPSIDQSDDMRDNVTPEYHILIACNDERQQVELLGRLVAEGISCRAYVV